MKDNAQKNLVMLAAAAVVLFAVNAGIWMLAKNGVIAAIENPILWGAFVVLNVVSIVWAASLLGLQPLVVAAAYTAGGLLAFQGVKGMTGVNVAEIATAGATYGAFGALAIGNAMAKMRLAFFNKGQVPFVFIIVGLLVVDAILNSQVSNAGGSVILKAVALPFLLAGVLIGAVWSAFNRFMFGRSDRAAAGVKTADHVNAAKAAVSQKLVIEAPELAATAKAAAKPAARPSAAPVMAKAAPASKVEAKAVPPAAKPAMATVQPKKPVVAAQPAAKPAATKTVPPPAPKKMVPEEAFFPLEIDKDDAFENAKSTINPMELSRMLGEASETDSEEAFEHSAFVSSLFKDSSSIARGGVMVKEPAVAVAAEKEAVKYSLPKPAPVAKSDSVPKPQDAVPKQDSIPKKDAKKDDWLSGHLDLLNKLK